MRILALILSLLMMILAATSTTVAQGAQAPVCVTVISIDDAGHDVTAELCGEVADLDVVGAGGRVPYLTSYSEHTCDREAFVFNVCAEARSRMATGGTDCGRLSKDQLCLRTTGDGGGSSNLDAGTVSGGMGEHMDFPGCEWDSLGGACEEPFVDPVCNNGVCKPYHDAAHTMGVDVCHEGSITADGRNSGLEVRAETKSCVYWL